MTPLPSLLHPAATFAQVDRVLVVDDPAVPLRPGGMVAGRDVWWHQQVPGQLGKCECEWVDAETPLFLLYTSGSTGNPKVR